MFYSRLSPFLGIVDIYTDDTQNLWIMGQNATDVMQIYVYLWKLLDYMKGSFKYPGLVDNQDIPLEMLNGLTLLPYV